MITKYLLHGEHWFLVLFFNHEFYITYMVMQVQNPTGKHLDVQLIRPPSGKCIVTQGDLKWDGCCNYQPAVLENDHSCDRQELAESNTAVPLGRIYDQCAQLLEREMGEEPVFDDPQPT